MTTMINEIFLNDFKGRIIAFEGLDNSFKETNYKAFVERLSALNGFADSQHLEIHTESFPRYGNQATLMVEKWLDGSLDRSHMMKHAAAVCNLYCADRLSYWYESVHGMKRNIERLYEADSVFVFDRYSSSNAIYNPMTDPNNVTAEDLKYDEKVYGVPTPDIVVWMRMKSFDVLKQLIANKANKDANEIDTSFIQSVWERSERAIQTNVFAQAGINLIVIDVLNEDNSIKSREEIADEIYAQIVKEISRL